MPDLEISNLPALAEAGVAATDPLAIADISASETKKVTVKDLIEAGVALIDAASIPAAKVGTLGTDQVATGAIQDDAVTNDKLANTNISLGGVSIALGGTDATPAFNLADATGYTTANLSGTITNAQLAGSIANSKLANSSVSFGGISLALGGTDATPAFNLTDATGYKTTELVGTITNAQLAGSIDISKLTGSTISIGGVSIALGGTDATPAFNLTDATGYPTSSLVGTITNAQLAGSIANAKLANSSVTLGGVSIALGASDATPAFDLTDATNYPTSSLTGTITNAQLAGSIAVSKLVSSSASIGGVTITLGTTDATPAFDLQDATGYPTTALVGTITNAQLAGSIAATKLVSGSITSTQLAANSVTDSELANNAVDTGAVQNGAITNDKVETSTSATTGLDGATKIRDASITPAKLNTSNLDRSLNVASGNLGINNAVSGGAATRSGITYNAQGLITGTVALAAADLPVATTSAVGGVSVGSGLSVSGAGALSVTNSVTAATVSGITFNAQGMITAATALVAGDLPVATTSAKGAVQITSGGGLTVDGSGNLTTSTSGISAGTFTKITVDTKGVATAGTTLVASDIPDLAASKITSGSFDAARIANDSIDGTKLSNASTAVFQSIAQSGYPTAQFNGQILFDTVSEDAYIWDGNAWQAITTLTKGSLVFGGNYNANTSKMTACTSAGLAAGLAVGSNLPTPSSTTDGVYVVVDTAGTPSAPAPVVAFSPPDYILGVTNASGSSWNEIDLSQTVAGQVASNITFTPYGQLSSTNVQDALQELETEKLALAGGTITGQVLIGNTGSLVFEGSTIDAYETTITVADPTSSDKTITFPDTTGTVITTGDTGTVTGTMLANDTIQNVDIKSDAAIAFSKLAALTSAQILVGNGSNVATAVAVTGDIGINNAGLTSITAGAIVDADISGSAAITGSKIATGTTSAVGVLQLTDSASSTSATTAATPAAVKIAKDAADAAATTANAALPKAGGTMTDNLIIDNGKELRLSESDGDGTNYTGLKAQAQTGDITLTLPAVAPTAGQVLKADASTPTTLTWAADSATDSTKMPLAGGTFTGDVTFTGDASNGLWDKSASAFVANLTGNVTGNVSGSAATVTGAAQSAITSLGTLTGLTVDGDLTLTGASANVTWDKSTDDLIFNDNAKAIFGTSSDGLELFHNGSHSVIKEAGTGALKVVTNSSFQIRNADEATGEYLINANVDGAVELYWNGTSTGKKLDTQSWGVKGYGYFAVDGSSGYAYTAPDNAKVSLGTGNDLQLWHDSSDNFLKASAGYLRVQVESSNLYLDSNETRIRSADGGEIQAKFIDDGAVELYHNNVKTFETEDNGAYLYGPEGGIAQLMLYADEGDDNADKWRMATSTSASEFTLFNFNDGAWETSIKAIGSSGVELYHDGTKKFETVAAGIKTNDGNSMGFGNHNDLTIFHDGTDNHIRHGIANQNLYIEGVDNEAGTPFIYLNPRRNQTGLSVKANQGVYLYYDDTKRAETTSTGFEVTGTVSDSKGNLRSIPRDNKTSAYVLVATDAGKCISITSGGITINTSIFSDGDAVTIINHSGSDQTITAGSGFALFNSADAATGNRTLAGRGMCTVYFVANDTAYISGAGLS